MAIFQSTYLTDFYKNGFNTIERNASEGEAPGRFIVNGAFDPRDGEAGLESASRRSETYDIKGVKLYTAEWHGASRAGSSTTRRPSDTSSSATSSASRTSTSTRARRSFR